MYQYLMTFYVWVVCTLTIMNNAAIYVCEHIWTYMGIYVDIYIVFTSIYLIYLYLLDYVDICLVFTCIYTQG